MINPCLIPNAAVDLGGVVESRFQVDRERHKVYIKTFDCSLGIGTLIVDDMQEIEVTIAGGKPEDKMFKALCDFHKQHMSK